VAKRKRSSTRVQRRVISASLRRRTPVPSALYIKKIKRVQRALPLLLTRPSPTVPRRPLQTYKPPQETYRALALPPLVGPKKTAVSQRGVVASLGRPTSGVKVSVPKMVDCQAVRRSSARRKQVIFAKRLSSKGSAAPVRVKTLRSRLCSA